MSKIKKRGRLDPGIRGAGVSVFHDLTLSRAAYVRNPCERGNDVQAVRELAWAVLAWLGPEAEELDEFGFERPRIYRDEPGRKKQKGDQNDLPPLYGIDCAVGALLKPWVEVVTFFPDEWKKQLKDDAMCRHIWRQLTLLEKSRVKIISSTIYDNGDEIDLVGDFDHNTLDAIGMNLEAAGRLWSRVLPG